MNTVMIEPVMAGSGTELSALEVHAESAASLLRAMANRHRLMILCLLSVGESSVGELNAKLPLSQSALSQHLAVLRNDGLVLTRRLAQTIFYRLADGAAPRIIAVLRDTYCRDML